MDFRVEPVRVFEGSPVLPGDKSLSHRAQLLAALAEGMSEIRGLSNGEDVASTGRCLQAMGVRYQVGDGLTRITGVGLWGLKAPSGDLDCGNSGSTIRMLMGILAGQSFTSRLFGDESLSRRPMGRVAEPLRKMGARIDLTRESFPPVTVHGVGHLKALPCELKVASAQVKSAILLAALYGDGETQLTGKIQSRDHTERLLPHFGVKIGVRPETISLFGGQTLTAADYQIPADPSSAAFWLAAACIVPQGRVRIDNLLLNPTRTGFFRAIGRMGARLQEKLSTLAPEPVGSVELEGSALQGISIHEDEVASLIDEIPMLAVLATYATGTTEIRGAEELRVKETDRIDAVATNLRTLGVEVDTYPDGLRITGPQKLRSGTIDSFHDHRIAMAFAIGALGAEGPITIKNAQSVSISYPAFFDTLKRLSRG